MSELILLVSLITPLVAALALAARVITSERTVARFAQTAGAISALTALWAIGSWLASGQQVLLTPPHTLFRHGHYDFVFELALDKSSVVFLALVQFTTGMVLRFSRFYLHREPGFRRFFSTVLMFQAAMSLLTLAGNLDLMFAGWEMVGVSSFLLIAFYHERHSAVRNALKTYSVYRVADMGMLLAACLAETGNHRELGFLLLLAAVGKSAQFPFSFWVPRAMEGPTPSSALFYGALSVHAGAYLLLRTFPLWGDVVGVRVLVGAVGLLTAALCSMFSRVQSTIKAQVGYASVTQVGLIFVELASGFRGLALIHMVCNALVRCYQLLVSPSAVAYLLRRQVSAGSARASVERAAFSGTLPSGWTRAIYVFALSEGYLKELLKGALWSPLRRSGQALVARRTVVLPMVAVGVLAALLVATRAPHPIRSPIAWGLVALAAACSCSALGSWRRPVDSFVWISTSSLAVAFAVFAMSPKHNAFSAGSYAAAIVALGALGAIGTAFVVPARGTIIRYAGLSEARPFATAAGLASALGLAAFPLLPTFLGEDLLLRDALRDSAAASLLVTGVLALNGYLAVRNFAFTFLGHRRTELQRVEDLALTRGGWKESPQDAKKVRAFTP